MEKQIAKSYLATCQMFPDSQQLVNEWSELSDWWRFLEIILSLYEIIFPLIQHSRRFEHKLHRKQSKYFNIVNKQTISNQLKTIFILSRLKIFAIDKH